MWAFCGLCGQGWYNTVAWKHVVIYLLLSLLWLWLHRPGKNSYVGYRSYFQSITGMHCSLEETFTFAPHLAFPAFSVNSFNLFDLFVSLLDFFEPTPQTTWDSYPYIWNKLNQCQPVLSLHLMRVRMRVESYIYLVWVQRQHTFFVPSKTFLC